MTRSGFSFTVILGLAVRFSTSGQRFELFANTFSVYHLGFLCVWCPDVLACFFSSIHHIDSAVIARHRASVQNSCGFLRSRAQDDRTMADYQLEKYCVCAFFSKKTRSLSKMAQLDVHDMPSYVFQKLSAQKPGHPGHPSASDCLRCTFRKVTSG